MNKEHKVLIMKKETIKTLANVTTAFTTCIGIGLANAYYIKEIKEISNYSMTIIGIIYILAIIGIIAITIREIHDGL